MLKNNNKTLIIFFYFFFYLLYSISAFAGGSTQVSRYQTIDNNATAAQINPLLAIAQFHFSPNVKTIGDAIQVILANTSYQLAPRNKLSKAVVEVLNKSLPITVRKIGPIKIDEALVVLMGKDVFNIIVDPLHRLINFEIKSTVARKLGVKDGR